jgi:hypothetical protein
MRIPLLHARNGGGAINTALGVEVGGLEFDGVGCSHS